MKRSPLTLRDVSAHRSVLYGFAALWILFHHTPLAFSGRGLSRVLGWIQHHGSCGVDMFLLLTGFGLYRSLNRDPRVGAFYLRRLERVALPASVATAIYLGLVRSSSTLVYVCSMLIFPFWLGVPGYWYVAFILVMYLIYPLIYRLQRSRPGMLWVLFVMAVAFAWLGDRYVGVDQLSTRELGVLRIPIFLLGCILAPRVDRGEGIPKWALPVCLAGFVGLTLLSGRPPEEDLFLRAMSYGFLAPALILVLTWLARLCTRGSVGRFVYRCFAFCGGISLEIYLLFQTINIALRKGRAAIGNPSPLKLNLTAAILTILLAVVLQWLCRLIARQFREVTIPKQD